MTARRKLVLPIEPDEDGYPRFRIETVWASTTAVSGELAIDNIPFFARVATYQDVVCATEEHGRLVFERVVHSAGNSLIRVIVHERERFAEIRGRLAELGCSTESGEQWRLIAVNIPPAVRLASVQRYLADLEDRDVAGYEEPILHHPIE